MAARIISEAKNLGWIRGRVFVCFVLGIGNVSTVWKREMVDVVRNIRGVEWAWCI